MKVFATHEWGHGSGAAPKHTRGYVHQFMQQFLKQHQIRSVVDMGYGDSQFSRYIDWTGIQYRGFDLVRSVIENSHRTFWLAAEEVLEFTNHRPVWLGAIAKLRWGKKALLIGNHGDPYI